MLVGTKDGEETIDKVFNKYEREREGIDVLHLANVDKRVKVISFHPISSQQPSPLLRPDYHLILGYVEAGSKTIRYFSDVVDYLCSLSRLH